jgi:hypothetical protein
MMSFAMLRFPVLSRFDGISITKMSFLVNRYFQEKQKSLNQEAL